MADVTRRSFFLFPLFAAAVQKLLPARFKPATPEPVVSDARRFLRNIGCPDGWVPYRITGILLHPVYDECGHIVAAVDVAIRPLGGDAGAHGMMCVPLNAISPRWVAEFKEKLNAARIFAEAEYLGSTP